MITLKFRGRVVGNVVAVDDRRRFEEYLRTLAGQQVEIIVRKPEKPPSDAVRKYYFAVVVRLLADYMKTDPKDAHAFLKQQCLDPGIESTTQHTTSTEQREYVERCRQFCHEQSVITPDPNEVYFDEQSPEVA